MSSALIGRPRFDMSRVIERTFGAISANASTLLLAALLLVGLPQVLWNFASTTFITGGDWAVSLFGSLAGMIVLMICGILLQGVVTHTVVSDLLGRKASMSDSVEVAMRSFWMLLAVGLASGLGVGLGTILLIVPGIFLALIWFVVGPVVVAERADFSQAFSRSMRLTENHRWMILGLSLVYMIGSGVLMIPVGIIVMMAGGAGGAVGTVIGAVVQSLISLVGAAGVAAVYVELRTVKEGGGRESVASIFE